MRVTDRHRALARNVLSREQRESVRRVIMQARSVRRADLDALAQLYGTDKSSRHHGYTRMYRRHFGARRHDVRSVLEIGVGGVTSISGYDTPAGGQSLRMWSDYFPKAEIVGIDINAKDVTGPRLHFEQGDQSDPVFLRSVIEKYGPFDIVIDDGSHIGRHIIASLDVLWDAVKPGGFYVIEDLALAYHPKWEGGPPGTPATAAELLKGKIDDTLGRYDQPFEPAISAMHVYAEICFLERTTRSA